MQDTDERTPLSGRGRADCTIRILYAYVSIHYGDCCDDVMLSVCDSD